MPLLTVIEQMYRKSFVLRAAGRGLNGSQQDEGLHIVNAMLDGVKTERFFFYQIKRSVYGVTQGQKEYTVGDESLGADWFGIERPQKIMSASVLINGDDEPNQAEIPLGVVLSYEEYQSIVTKNTQSTVPLVLYYQWASEDSVSLGLATLWPVPSQTYEQRVVIYTPQTVLEFSDVNADYIVPQGFRDWMEYEGAVRVQSNYPDVARQYPLTPSVIQMAKDYKARVKARMSTPLFIGSDPGALGRTGTIWTWPFNGRTTLPG